MSQLWKGHWGVLPQDRAVHIVPCFEDKTIALGHSLSETCWCVPRTEIEDPKTLEPYAMPLIIHRCPKNEVQ